LFPTIIGMLSPEAHFLYPPSQYSGKLTEIVISRLKTIINQYRRDRLSGSLASVYAGSSRESGRAVDPNTTNMPGFTTHQCSIKAGSVEFSILTLLVRVYGPALLGDEAMDFVIETFAKEGGIRLVQRALWGTDDVGIMLDLLLGEVLSYFVELSEKHAKRHLSLRPPSIFAPNFSSTGRASVFAVSGWAACIRRTTSFIRKAGKCRATAAMKAFLFP
jgi:hypothetical protein